MRIVLNKIELIIIFLLLTFNISLGQELYQLNEIDIYVNNFNILDEYNSSNINTLIGTPNSIIEGGQATIDEFGYNTYEYKYGTSYILFRNELISDVNITDSSLSINNINVGDPLLEVFATFTKVNQGNSNNLYIIYGDFTITFFYNSADIITKIIYFVPI